jgi:uncharacterized protein YqhQ
MCLLSAHSSDSTLRESGAPAEETAGPRPRIAPRDLPPDFAMGGQAVLEGVMMRGPSAYAIAVRRPQGDIEITSRRFWPVVRRKRWLRFPVIRGAVSLVEMLLLGYRALDYSANVAEQGHREQEEAEKAAKEGTKQTEESDAGEHEGAVSRSDAAASLEGAGPDAHEDASTDGENARERAAAGSGQAAPTAADVEGDRAPASTSSTRRASSSTDRSLGPWTMLGVFLLSMALAMFLFVALPNVATHGLGKLFGMASGGASAFTEVDRPIAYNLVAGVVRALVIVAYIWAISFLKDIRRLFQYHGAEHKVVMAFEQDLPLDVEHVRPVTTLHPRCGTTFIAVVILVSIIVFAVLAALIVVVYPGFAKWSVWANKPVIILLHILFMPLVAGVAYEITRRAGKRPDHWLYRMLLTPGYLFQRITTRQPEDSMIEVALAAFNEALEPSRL